MAKILIGEREMMRKFIYRAKGKLWRGAALMRSKMTPKLSLVNIVRTLPAYAPSSAGEYRQVAALTLLTTNAIFPAIRSLIHQETSSGTIFKAEEVFLNPEVISRARRMREIFLAAGTDKPLPLYLIYAKILSPSAEIQAIAEIGIGTNNTDVVSNMGSGFKPGSSQRAFREFLPAVNIYGADVDRRVLYEEDRIQTRYVDQNDLQSLLSWTHEIDRELYLLVDDGLHSPLANVNSLIAGLTKVVKGGWIVIEDIGESSLDIWIVLGNILSHQAHYWYIFRSSGNGYIFVVQNKGKHLSPSGLFEEDV